MRLPFADVRPDERAATFGAFLVLFGVMAAHALLETSRDALFLARLEARQLPVVYLLIALVAIPLTTARHGLFAASDRRRAFSAWLVFAALVTALFWGLVARANTWTLYALYVWSGLFSTLSVLQFWIVVGDSFTVSQAKRVFALIGTGSILGAIAGSVFAQLVAANADSRAILLAASAVLAGTAGGPFLLRAREHDDEGAAPGARESWFAEKRRLLAQPYVKRLAILALLSAITLTFADYIFKSIVQGAVLQSAGDGAAPMTSELAADRLAWTFATAYLAFNCLSLIAQVTVVGWMTRNLGIDRVLAFLPALLLFGSTWLAVGGGMLAALCLKGFDGTFRHSLHRTASEVLYVPLSGEWRASIKGLVDILGQRGGQAIASLGILAANGMHRNMPGEVDPFEIYLAVGVALLCIAWVFVAAGLKRPYFDLFRATLERESKRARTVVPDLDLASLEALIAALSRPDEREVVAALELLAEQGRTRLVPALILYHPSPVVVEHALEQFEQVGRTDHLGMLEHLLERPDGGVRRAALLHLPPGPARDAALEKSLADETQDVRATAIVGLLSRPESAHPRVASILDTIVSAGSSEAKRALAEAIRHAPHPKFDGVLVALAEGRDPRHCGAVAAAMGANPKPVFVKSLLSMLEWRACREEARRALVEHGPVALEALTRAMREGTANVRVRRHLPRTIARFDPQTAATILMRRLLEDDDGVVRYKILRAIGRLRTNDPSIRLDEKILDRAADENARQAFRLLAWRVALARGATAQGGREARTAPRAPSTSLVGELLGDLLHDKHLNAIERLFRILQLEHPHEDLVRMYRGLRSERRRSRDTSRELLRHVVASPLREAVAALVDDTSDEARLAAGARWAPDIEREAAGDTASTLGAILDRGGSVLRSIAAVRAAELGLVEQEPSISRVRVDDDPVLAVTIAGALERLRTAAAAASPTTV